MFLVILTIFVLLLVFYNAFQSKIDNTRKPIYRIPSGPQRWPILGNLIQMVKDPHLKLSKWTNHYGKLYTLYLGNQQAMVVNDSKLVKELFSHSASTGKFKTDTMLLISQGPYGVLNTEGKAWAEQRQFCMKTMIEFGFGTSALEPLILDEVHQVLRWIERETETNHGEVLLNDVLKHATNNALWTIISGERIGLDDHKVVNLLDNFVEGMQQTVKTGLGFFPWLKYFAPKLSGYTAFDIACKDLHHFIENIFRDHKKSYVEGSPRDVVDSYLEQMNNAKSPCSPFYGTIGMKNSVSTLVEVFTGGGDTSSATINWLTFYLSWNPIAQKKLCSEIDEVIGQYRDPSLQDKARMPFTEAVILETFRYSSLLPLGIIHQLTEDLKFQQYSLPKGLLIIPNMYHCHHSKEIWNDPENFRPERFLECPSLKDFVIPFQPGKRSCPGEPLARDVIFLFATKMFQKWEVAPIPKISKEQYFKSDTGMLIIPKHLKILMKKRDCT